MSVRGLGLVTTFLFFSIFVNGQNLIDSLDQSLQQIWQKGQVVGFSVSIFSEDSVYFMKAYGYADLKTQKPYRISTVQKIASVSKLFLGVALMKACELGLIDLNDDINKYLPFELANPRVKNSKITVLHLATHTSGMRKSIFDYRALYFPTRLKLQFRWRYGLRNFVYLFLAQILNSNKYLSLKQFLFRIYSPEGKWYHPRLNFIKAKPGERWIYNNDDASFLGLAISRVSGMTYAQFVHKYIFEPLNMKNTHFDFEQRDSIVEQKSCLYHFGIEVPNDYLLILYPAGGIETNIVDLTRFMQAMIAGYRHGNQILTKQDYRFMLKRQIKPRFNQGILWRFRDHTWIGHRGDIAGATTFAYFDKNTGMGYVLLSNSAGTKAIEQEHQVIINLLELYSLKLHGDCAPGACKKQEYMAGAARRAMRQPFIVMVLGTVRKFLARLKFWK